MKRKSKMSDTIKTMYKKVDTLFIDQVESQDLIMIDENIVEVVSVTGLGDNYIITFLDDFLEKDFIEVSDYSTFDLYVMVDE
jgi:tRNA A22 N-methylase